MSYICQEGIYGREKKEINSKLFNSIYLQKSGAINLGVRIGMPLSSLCLLEFRVCVCVK